MKKNFLSANNSGKYICTSSPSPKGGIEMTCKKVSDSPNVSSYSKIKFKKTVQKPSVRNYRFNTKCTAPTPSNFSGGTPVCPAGSIGFRIDSSQLVVGCNVFNPVPSTDLQITICTPDLKYFTWSANRAGIVSATVYGGSGGQYNVNTCSYSNDETGDSVPFAAPLDGGSQVPNIIHLDFCLNLNLYYLNGLQITTTANTEFNRTHHWTIQKLASTRDFTITPGQTITENYTVTLSDTCEDTNYEVYGSITVTNTNVAGAGNNFDITLNSLTDAVPPTATITSGPSLPYVLPAGQSVVFQYSTSLANVASGTNTATVNASFAATSRNFSATAPWDLSNPTNIVEIDKCVSVLDDHAGLIGNLCGNCGGQSQSISYQMLIGPYPECGEYVFNNTAKYVADTETGSSTASINIHIPCSGGCTLSIGYWKSHSKFGPAPYDDTWGQLSNGANTQFFYSGKTYYQVLQTSPNGNAYYILAQQYIATQLNQLNGASIPSAVLTAYNQTSTLLNNPTYTPIYVGVAKGSSSLRKQYIALSEILDDYNIGATGPGHCTE
jgi:hypothetical protein